MIKTGDMVEESLVVWRTSRLGCDEGSTTMMVMNESTTMMVMKEVPP
jgi:hypothetical protein